MAIIAGVPRDRIAEIARDHGWRREVSDVGNIRVDDYMLGARHIRIRWSRIELATFIEVGGEMCTQQALHDASIDGRWCRDNAEALRSDIPAELRRRR